MCSGDRPPNHYLYPGHQLSTALRYVRSTAGQLIDNHSHNASYSLPAKRQRNRTPTDEVPKLDRLWDPIGGTWHRIPRDRLLLMGNAASRSDEQDSVGSISPPTNLSNSTRIETNPTPFLPQLAHLSKPDKPGSDVTNPTNKKRPTGTDSLGVPKKKRQRFQVDDSHAPSLGQSSILGSRSDNHASSGSAPGTSLGSAGRHNGASLKGPVPPKMSRLQARLQSGPQVPSMLGEYVEKRGSGVSGNTTNAQQGGSPDVEPRPQQSAEKVVKHSAPFIEEYDGDEDESNGGLFTSTTTTGASTHAHGDEDRANGGLFTSNTTTGVSHHAQAAPEQDLSLPATVPETQDVGSRIDDDFSDMPFLLDQMVDTGQKEITDGISQAGQETDLLSAPLDNYDPFDLDYITIQNAMDQFATDQVATDQVATDQVATDQVTTDQVATDQVATDQVVTDQVALDQAATGHRTATDHLVATDHRVATNHQVATDQAVDGPISMHHLAIIQARGDFAAPLLKTHHNPKESIHVQTAEAQLDATQQRSQIARKRPMPNDNYDEDNRDEFIQEAAANGLNARQIANKMNSRWKDQLPVDFKFTAGNVFRLAKSLTGKDIEMPKKSKRRTSTNPAPVARMDARKVAPSGSLSLDASSSDSGTGRRPTVSGKRPAPEWKMRSKQALYSHWYDRNISDDDDDDDDMEMDLMVQREKDETEAGYTAHKPRPINVYTVYEHVQDNDIMANKPADQGEDEHDGGEQLCLGQYADFATAYQVMSRAANHSLATPLTFSCDVDEHGLPYSTLVCGGRTRLFRIEKQVIYSYEGIRPGPEAMRFSPKVYEIKQEITVVDRDERKDSPVSSGSRGTVSQDTSSGAERNRPTSQADDTAAGLAPTQSSAGTRTGDPVRLPDSMAQMTGPLPSTLYREREEANTAAARFILKGIVLTHKTPRFPSLDMIDIWKAKQQRLSLEMRNAVEREGALMDEMTNVRARTEEGWVMFGWRVWVEERVVRGPLN